MKTFVTVGSTRFDELIAFITHEDVLKRLKDNGITCITIQHGKSQMPSTIRPNGLKITAYDYKSSIRDDILNADFVISHGGAGTVLEVLRAQKKLLVVINDQLMHNHQAELAEELSQREYALCCYTKTLLESLVTLFNFQGKKYPDPTPFALANLLDDEFELEKIN
jgi:beta-1,4-N-acetylglucosaminyltransferase